MFYVNNYYQGKNPNSQAFILGVFYVF